MKIKVRHNKRRAVWAQTEPAPGGLRLVDVAPLDGPLPEVQHLLGQRFPNIGAVRRALVAAMKGAVGDTLDNVLLSRAAYDAWIRKALQAANEMRGTGVSSDTIPDERARERPNGSLEISIDLPTGRRISMIVPKGQWAWRPRPH